MKNFRSGDSSDDSDSESLDEFTNEMEKRAQIAHQNRLEKTKAKTEKTQKVNIDKEIVINSEDEKN